MKLLVLLLYRLLIGVAGLPVAIFLLVRVLRGREALSDWVERMGLAIGGADGPHLWLHAASNGELASVRPVIVRLHNRHPGLKILITTNSLTGRSLARDWQIEGLTACLAPIDSRWAAAGLIRRYSACAHVIVETEFWPNRIFAFQRRNLPVLALGARLSRRTARSWRRLFGLAEQVLSAISYVSPQDKGSRRRLLQLGMAPDRLGPVLDLKACYTPPDTVLEVGLSQAFNRDLTWLAASTHAGEDEIMLRAHHAYLATAPDARLIIAPRHPHRGPAIAALAREAGLQTALRSAGEPPGGQSVYVADTLGEMPLWYRLAGTTFIGGTLLDKGGHTPFEPAAFDTTLIHGPDTRNFASIFRKLDKSDASIEIRSAEALTQALVLLRDPTRRDKMRRSARAKLARPADLDAILDRLSAALPQKVKHLPKPLFKADDARPGFTK